MVGQRAAPQALAIVLIVVTDIASLLGRVGLVHLERQLLQLTGLVLRDLTGLLRGVLARCFHPDFAQRPTSVCSYQLSGSARRRTWRHRQHLTVDGKAWTMYLGPV